MLGLDRTTGSFVAIVCLATGTAGCWLLLYRDDSPAPSGPFDAGGRANAGDGSPAPEPCPNGGPAGSSPVMIGPPPGGVGDLWQALHVGGGVGEALTMPRAGVIDRVDVQIFADPGAHGCELRLYRWCGGVPVLAALVQAPASAFPVYVIDANVHATMWDQDLRTTAMIVAPPVVVASGERVDAVFSSTGGMLVSVITMHDITPDGHAVFPQLDQPDQTDWDYHAQIHLR